MELQREAPVMYDSEINYIDRIHSVLEDAGRIGYENIVLSIGADCDNTYLINITPEGYLCDAFPGAMYEDLEALAIELYNRVDGNITDVRAE